MDSTRIAIFCATPVPYPIFLPRRPYDRLRIRHYRAGTGFQIRPEAATYDGGFYLIDELASFSKPKAWCLVCFLFYSAWGMSSRHHNLSKFTFRLGDYVPAYKATGALSIMSALHSPEESYSDPEKHSPTKRWMDFYQESEDKTSGQCKKLDVDKEIRIEGMDAGEDTHTGKSSSVASTEDPDPPPDGGWGAWSMCTSMPSSTSTTAGQETTDNTRYRDSSCPRQHMGLRQRLWNIPSLLRRLFVSSAVANLMDR